MKREVNGRGADRDAERVRWINEYRASGMGLRQFARRHGLRPGQLHYWVYAPSKRRGARGPVPTFQEVRLATPAWSAGSWGAEISLPGGTTMRLARETDVAWARDLIDGLRRPCSP